MTNQTANSEYLVPFDLRLHSITAVKKAAYRYSDRFVTDFELKDQELLCRLRFTQQRSEDGFQRAIDDFKKEALDQDLRERLKAETEPVRNLILAHAFSKTGISGDEQVPED
jgi:His-Xaa-Ser system protein HxsD